MLAEVVEYDPESVFTPLYNEVVAELGLPVLEPAPAPPPERVEKCSQLGKGVTYVQDEDGKSSEVPCAECDGLHS